MTSQQILEKYLTFFKDKGHKQIPNVSLVPENDSTLLFVNSGMFPLVPYLLGETHPLGKRLVNVQRCLRFEDLEEIGDYIHTLAFHMIGNWSLGDYFKKEQLPWKYEFFIEILKLDPQKIVATVFAGDQDAPRDEESIAILKKVFSKYGIDAKIDKRIYLYNKEQGNWWQRGDAIGELGGPSSEIFYYLGKGDPVGKSPAEHEQEFVEIGNSVFLEYIRAESGWKKLPQTNVDYGGGFERIAMAVQGKQDIFETDNFWPIIQRIEKITNKKYTENDTAKKNMRVLADHIRTAVFMAMDGVTPSNKDHGYVLRRILRRMVRIGKRLNIEKNISVSLVEVVCEMFLWLYPDLKEKQKQIEILFAKEEEKFRKTLNKGAKQAQKILATAVYKEEILIAKAFQLYQSIGYPSEIFLEDIKDKGITIDSDKYNEMFDEKLKQHQEKSRKGAEHKFKGGLADQSEQTTKYHTTTHLLLWALKQTLGQQVTQQGSNITGKRLRFDFNHTQKLTLQETEEVENLINKKITEAWDVNFEIMSKQEAKKRDACYMPNKEYGEQVKVYYFGKSLNDSFSKEFCGGPHIRNTNELKPVKIYKQDKIGEGKIRIYAHFI